MLKVKQLTKTFGQLTAVDSVDFDIPKGTILGLIGQNGSGKTTTFRLILDLLHPDNGEVLWNNKPLSKAVYNQVGYLPEERGLYPKVSIEKQLVYFAELRGKTKKDIVPHIDEWMDKFQVKGKKTDKVKTLSKGNQQKIQLIATLIHEPTLIILDEPFSGLDPVNADLLETGIMEAKEKGASIIFSSHNMNNVEELCDKLVMLRDGKVVLNGRVQDIREQYGRTKLYLETPIEKSVLKEMPGVQEVKQTGEQTYSLSLSSADYGKEIFQRVTKDGYITTFDQQPPTLEEIFKWKAGEVNE
ncbi:MAG: ABC transporter ATP-binding protein [Pisciglobus halotolerans]|nr:ABC transporter ATP-binding protein [Pisciglobus halotolerans]